MYRPKRKKGGGFMKYGYKAILEISIDELPIRFKGHRRLETFIQKGCSCAHPGCDKVGTRLVLCIDHGGGLHWDVYTDEGIMMTVDHINPKSKGGKDEIENYQPMCHNHNMKKGNKVPSTIIVVK